MRRCPVICNEASSIQPYTRLTPSFPACNIITLVVVLFLVNLSLWSAPNIASAQEDTASEIDRLIKDLQDEDPGVRGSAADSLRRIGEKAEPAMPALIEALKDEDPNVRRSAAAALGNIGEKAEPAVPALIDALQDEGAYIRLFAAQSLGQIGEKAEPAVPALIEALKDEDPNVRWGAAAALGAIATPLRDAKKINSLGVLIQARDALAEHNDPGVNTHAPTVRRAIEYLEQLWWKELFDWAADNKGWLALAAIYPLWLATCLVIFWRKPAALLTINDKLRPHEYKLFELKFPLRHLLIVGFFNYHPRLLDAWVAGHVDQALENFARKRTVADRSVHIPIPVELGSSTVAELRGPDLLSVFSEGSGLLLIWGEGGAGKTSIACQIARWGMADESEQRATQHIMLPVLIEQELNFDIGNDKDAFIEAIRGGLQRLIQKPNAPLPLLPEHLFHELLKQRRILVIVDHLSEMSAETRKRVRPDVPDFPIGALIVTSRIEEELGDVPKRTLKPMRVTGDYLFEFLGAYLRARGVRDLFPDRRFGDAGGRIAELVGDRQVTVLLVKLFLDQMIRREERSEEGRDALPQNIPDLMLRYVHDINESTPDEERRDPLAVYKDSQAVAWACLKETFRPAAADIDDDVLPALKAIEDENAKDRLTYLDERLHLIETIEPGYDKVRYLLDPLAEYLAGLHLVAAYRDDEEKWRAFLAQADGMEGGLEAIKGFLLAVHDCCLAKQKDEAIPQFLIDECANRAGFDPEAVAQARLQQRVAHYTKQLRAPDPADRKIAVEALGEIGEPAVPALSGALKDEDADVWASAADALRQIGEPAVPALIEASKDENEGVRRSAADDLGWIGKKAETAVPALIEALSDALNDEAADVQWNAAYALGRIGEKAEAAVPALIKEAAVPALIEEAAVPALIEASKDENADVRWNAASALGKIGEKAEPAVPALIEALKDEQVVQAVAAYALGQIGEPAVPALIEALKDENADVRRSAAYLLEKIGVKSDAALSEPIEGK